MKIVLDTNVVVSGLLQSQGNPAHVLTLALAGAVQVCHDKRILAEYAEVLARPRFKFDPKRVREVLNLEKAVETAKYAKYAKGQRICEFGLRTFRVKLPWLGKRCLAPYFAWFA
jgi:predicted nucleic acid-binding protein